LNRSCHSVMHYSKTSTYTTVSFKPEKLFVDGRTDGRTYVSTGTDIWTGVDLKLLRKDDIIITYNTCS